MKTYNATRNNLELIIQTEKKKTVLRKFSSEQQLLLYIADMNISITTNTKRVNNQSFKKQSIAPE